jgi:hypothetical protein
MIPRTLYWTNEHESPRFTTDLTTQREIHRAFRCLIDPRSVIAPFLKSFDWLKEKCFRKQSKTLDSSISTLTMDPAIRMESSIALETSLLLQSNSLTPVVALSSFQRETILSFSSTTHASSQYHWTYQNHTIFTTDDSIWSACTKYDDDPIQRCTTPPPIQSRTTSSTSQFSLSRHNICQSDYDLEPPLSRVAPRQLVEI